MKRWIVSLIMVVTTPILGQEVGDISSWDATKMTTRVESRSYKYFGFGPSRIFGSTASEPDYQFAFGRVFEPNPRASLKAISSITFNSDDVLWDGSFGANGYLTSEDMSPFITGDLGVGVSKRKAVKNAHAGFTAGIGGGLILFRTSSTPMELMFRMSRLLKKKESGGTNVLSARLSLFF